MKTLTALLLAAALPAFAEQVPSGDPQQVSTFGEVIDVRVVNLEVVVTDREGGRVPGLGRGDFRLFVADREVPIEYFTEVREGQAVASTANAPEPAGVPSLVGEGPVGTSYLVFIDNLFSLRARRDEVLRALKADVTRLGPEDRMTLVAYDGRRLESFGPWTGSAEGLARAIDKAMAQRAYGIDRKAELGSMESSRRLASEGGPGLDLDQVAYARQLTDRIERAVMAAVSTLRAFAKAPGRKVLLLLAGGWPDSPAAYAGNVLGPVYDSRLPWNNDLYGPLTDTANRLGYTIYPVDVPGWEAVGADAFTSTGQVEHREEEIHSALTSIAAGTGGRPLLNESRLAALGTAHADTRSYYWLGFTPSWRENDLRHRIKVEVLRPGLTVRSRAGFLDLSRRSEISMMLEHSLLFGGGNTASMPMEVGATKRAGRKEMEVPVSLTIPLTSITVLPVGGGRYVADLELRVAALDDRGDRSEIPVIPLHFTFDSAPPRGGGHVRYDARLKLRRIAQHLIVALFDPLSSKITTAEADVAP